MISRRHVHLSIWLAIGFLCVAVPIALSGMGGSGQPGPQGRNLWMEAMEKMGPEEQARFELQASYPRAMADISLMIREQADFLITPALLVQEVVSDGVVPTYPEE
ncbi:MAG: hypothetical protein QHH07_01425 [Sedimentisphaerales bacterium]|nr:hypothetical protein [Sedimentisphaerales bacterium]